MSEEMSEPPRQVVLVDIQIPYWDLAAFLLKAALAGIPVGMILGVLLYILKVCSALYT
jgi:hypothetical protein